MYKIMNVIEKATTHKGIIKMQVFTVYRMGSSSKLHYDTMNHFAGGSLGFIVPLVAMEHNGDRWIVKEISEEGANKIYREALDEAFKLVNKYFSPELDNLASKTLGSIMFKVLSEWDLWDEGELEVPKKTAENWDKRASAFFRKYRDLLHGEEAEEYSMYTPF